MAIFDRPLHFLAFRLCPVQVPPTPRPAHTLACGQQILAWTETCQKLAKRRLASILSHPGQSGGGGCKPAGTCRPPVGVYLKYEKMPSVGASGSAKTELRSTSDASPSLRPHKSSSNGKAGGEQRTVGAAMHTAQSAPFLAARARLCRAQRGTCLLSASMWRFEIVVHGAQSGRASSEPPSAKAGTIKTILPSRRRLLQHQPQPFISTL